MSPTGSPPAAPDSSDALVAKVVSMAVLGLVPFALGVLPARLASYLGWDRREKGVDSSSTGVGGVAISLLLCFGGGVLLCTTFLHLQPEVREGVEALQESGQLPELSGIHLSELLLCLGFFLVYLAEELVHAVLDSRHEEEEAAALHRTVSLRRCARHEGPTTIPRVTLGNRAGGAPSTTHSSSSSSSAGPADGASSTQILFLRSSSSYLDVKTVSGPLDAAEARMTPAPPAMAAPVGDQHHPHHHHHHRSHVSYDTLRADSVAASLKGLLAVLALSFHAVFEGLAVGLESSAASVWVLCGAIAAHKFVIAFCVGVELVSARTRPALLVAYVATFAMVTPLGIGAGIAVTAAESGAAEGMSSSVVAVVLQGMAAGTLLYVVFFEVLQRERAGSHAASAGLCHLLAILLGFGLMLGLQILSGHEHHSHAKDGGHGHDHHSHTTGAVTQAIQELTESIVAHATSTEAPHHHHHEHEHR
ncbi:zinc transporter ZIP1-like [Hetaerina americana]|uniref:zinc transporter ZIP1-like n=1 Tax=Hetaerina americana TaxID=62018 RepID=UPI003A7F120F